MHRLHRRPLDKNMQVFDELGRQIELIWRDHNYNEAKFPALAAQALREFGLPEKVSAWDTINWALSQTELPTQRDLPGRFGDPPITLYNSPRFHIDIYFWLEGTTSIHQHAFCGAFQVIHGSSIHSQYDFKTNEVVNMFTEIGEINLEQCELLKVGDVSEIKSGREFIHALFHLDQPSATIVVRTHRSPLDLPQFDYRKPFLAVDPFFEEPNLAKKLQCVIMPLRAKRPDADDLLANLIKESDFQSTLTILSRTRGFLNGGHLERFFDVENSVSRYDRMFDLVKEKHGALADVIPAIFAHQDKLQEILNRRNFITNPEHRFFLALLLNVDGKERIMSLVKTRYTEDDPIEKILDWTTELAQTKVFGSNLPNALGIEDFNDFDTFVLEDMLKGSSLPEIQTKLGSEMQSQEPEAFAKDIAKRHERLNNSIVLQPLLGELS